jgi:hypothetical protein
MPRWQARVHRRSADRLVEESPVNGRFPLRPIHRKSAKREHRAYEARYVSLVFGSLSGCFRSLGSALCVLFAA